MCRPTRSVQVFFAWAAMPIMVRLLGAGVARRRRAQWFVPPSEPLGRMLSGNSRNFTVVFQYVLPLVAIVKECRF